MAIPAINVLGNPNVTEGNFQIAIEDLRKSVIGSGKAYDSANTYSQYDTCVSGGIVYYSKINSNTGNTPAVNANWGLVSELIKLIVSPVTNALAKINADGTLKNSAIIEDDNGNVGIGTSVLNNKLEVNGSIGFGSTTGNGRIYSDANWGCLLQSDVSSPGFAEFAFLNNAAVPLAWIDTAGNLLLKSGNGGLGYGTGAGGTVTQLTSKSTAVTLNKPTGQIIMNNSALAAGASVYFTLNNNLISSIGDQINVAVLSSVLYLVDKTIVSNSGYAIIKVTNNSAESLSDSLVLTFSIIKGANS